MNTDNNAPNNFSPDDEPNFIQMPYPVRVHPVSLTSEASPRNYIRPIIAIIMVLLLIFSVSYMLLQSLQLDRNTISTNQIAEDFDIVLTGVSTTIRDCENAPHVTLGGTNPPTRYLCVCGSLYTDESAVNYVLRLRDARGSTVAQTERSNQKEGTFCQLWELSNTLAEGRYAVEVAPNHTSPALETIWLTIALQPF